ncbi:MAG: hypothetical protein E8D49_10920 [Nitrospira sp.]|nr:MAG: hypothetical protein E8D49_10920 [Nitrospira sp.]
MSISILNVHVKLFVIGALVFAFVAPGTGLAQDPTSVVGLTSPAPPQAIRIGPPDPEGAKQSLSWEVRPGRSYLIPAVEILAYGFLLNLL